MNSGGAKMVDTLDRPANETLTRRRYQLLEFGNEEPQRSEFFGYEPRMPRQLIVTVTGFSTHIAAREHVGEGWGQGHHPAREELLLAEQRWPWLASVVSDLDSILRLPANWDSYGAPPIDPRAALTALRMLIENDFRGPAPHVVPTAHRGVQLEWEDEGGGVEIAITPSGTLSVLTEDDDVLHEHESQSTVDPFLLAALDRLRQR
jgi:hypothetical protein